MISITKYIKETGMAPISGPLFGKPNNIQPVLDKHLKTDLNYYKRLKSDKRDR